MQWLKRIGWLNVLLVFMPAAFLLDYLGSPASWVFAASAVAIIPLAGLMGKSTEMLAERLGPGIGGLLNASFGNAAELIIAIFALREGLIGIVKASITGSILGNILLVLGASFLVGGVRYPRQKFNATAAGMSATLLALAAAGLLIPAAFHAHLEIHHEQADERGLSLEVSIVLFVVYVLMLLFSLKTHRHLYMGDVVEEHAQHHKNAGEVLWSVRVAVTVLLLATLAVALMSELLVGAIEEARAQLGWTEIFVGVILVAIIGNAAEHSTAILVAMKNQMDLSFQIAIGSGLQIALFVAPVLVFIGHIPGFAEMDLIFSMMEVVAVVVSVLIVGLVAYDGQSNWMEGLLLLAVYALLGIAFFNLPESEHVAPAAAEPFSLVLPTQGMGSAASARLGQNTIWC